MTEQQRASRNLKPHKAAVAAMYLYGKRYSEFGGGSMDFWDQLHDSHRRICRDLVANVLRAEAEKD